MLEMAESQEKHGEPIRKGGKYCVAGLPNGVSCKNRATNQNQKISFHKFPKEVKTRNTWTKFVRRHRPGFAPSSSSVLCSDHFKPEFFTRMPGVIPGAKDVRRLKAGAVPTIDSTVCDEGETDMRERRRVSIRHFWFVCLYCMYASLFVLNSVL